MKIPQNIYIKKDPILLTNDDNSKCFIAYEIFDMQNNLLDLNQAINVLLKRTMKESYYIDPIFHFSLFSIDLPCENLDEIFREYKLKKQAIGERLEDLEIQNAKFALKTGTSSTIYIN